jgi:hypothetical protein
VTCSAAARVSPGMRGGAEVLRSESIPLDGGSRDYDALLELNGDARVVPI